MRLIQAAEKIFARDGFEAAKLEEIASDAGYTRGAFYANFDSKEDLFLALLEGEINARIDRVESKMHALRDPDAKLRAFREFFLTLCQDRRWSLIALEFKLFAVRHPDVKTRLAALNRRMVASRIGILEQIIAGTGRQPLVSAAIVARSISAVTHALALEHMLDRAFLADDDLTKIVGTYFDSLLGISPGSVDGAEAGVTIRRRNPRRNVSLPSTN